MLVTSKNITGNGEIDRGINEWLRMDKVIRLFIA